MLHHVAHLAVRRHEYVRPQPVVHLREFRLTRMPRHMDMRLTLGDHADALGRQRVLDATDLNLVARDLLRREDHRVVGVERDRVAAIGDTCQRRALLALPAGGDHQHLVLGQAHRLVGADRVGEILQIARRARHLDDPVERTPGHAQLAAGFLSDFAERVEPRRVRREAGDHHAALGLADLFKQTFPHGALAARRGRVEDVGRIANEDVDALVADRHEALGLGRIADHRVRIELPVAGVEHAPVRRVDQQRVRLRNRMRHLDEGEAERPELEIAAHRDHLELHAVGDALFLELAADQAHRERGRVDRHAEIFGEIRQRADVILMAVRDDDAEQVVDPVLDEGQIGQDHVDAGILRIGEGDAEIDHHPLALAAVQVDVHADFAGAAKATEKEFVLRSH